jgi:hypothetical protein
MSGRPYAVGDFVQVTTIGERAQVVLYFQILKMCTPTTAIVLGQFGATYGPLLVGVRLTHVPDGFVPPAFRPKPPSMWRRFVNHPFFDALRWVP